MRPLPDEHDEGGRQWFSVRSHYRFIGEFNQNIYEERVVLFESDDFDHAIRQAQDEAAEYADVAQCEILPLFQSFKLFDEVGTGSEIFSLMREDELPPNEYLDRFFDTGTERTSTTP